jgi:hypothetical protein
MTHITIFLSIWIFLGGWGYFELRIGESYLKEKRK